MQLDLKFPCAIESTLILLLNCARATSQVAWLCYTRELGVESICTVSDDQRRITVTYTIEDAKNTVKAFWKVLDSNDASGLANFNFAPNYTFQGQPLTGEETAKFMQAGFDELSYHRYAILDLFAEKQGNEIKVCVRTHFTAARKSDEQKFQGMTVNVVTILAEDGAILSNVQVGVQGLADCSEIDYFVEPEGVIPV